MAIDQRDVSSTLRFMDDRALQQYAAMHKNDPYIFPLAFQESQNRQRLRMSQQSAQGMQPQPKVNEQALAQMAPQQLPEEMGIGALPADNMQQMADGGIAGYDDADFVSRSEPVVMMAGGGVARYQVGGVVAPELLSKYQQELEEMGVGTRMQFSPDVKNVVGQIQAAQEAAYLKKEQQRMLRGPYADAAPAPAATATKKESPFEQERARNMARVANEGYTRGDPRALPTMPSAKEQLSAGKTPVDAAPKPDTGRRNKPVVETAPKETVTDPSAKPDTGGLDTLMAEYTRKQELAQGAARNADVQYASSLRGEGAKLVADEEKRIKDQVDPYKDREARLLKQEKGLEGMGDKYLGLALLQAGAAMMTTPGGIGMALGKGVQVGSERYIQGMEKINAAKDKFADARDRLDDLRLNRSDMNARDIKDAKKEARTLERQAEALFYTGAREDLKMTDKNLTTLLGLAADNLKTKNQQAFEATQTTRKIESTEKIARDDRNAANARAVMPTGADRTAMMLGTGKTDAARLESGMKKMQELTADKSGMAAVKLLAEANAKLMPGEPRLTMQDLLTSAREYSTLMYGPKVADVAPTRDRPR
jgi:hypothetical protein